jgi:predicted lipoprotein
MQGGWNEMAETSIKTATSKGAAKGWIGGIAAAVLLVGAIAYDTTIVQIGSSQDAREQAFNPDLFGMAEFPRIRDAVMARAPDAVTLAEALAADKKAATAKYATMAGAFPVVPVQVAGTVADGKSGIFTVNVAGLPAGVVIRVQTGPAINGTELRDITGDIGFGAFTNQIEFQNAGAGINRAMAEQVLAKLDRDSLSGKQISVVGAFTMINPKNWLITPVTLEVAE